MAHVREERALGAVCLFGRLPCHEQIVFDLFPFRDVDLNRHVVGHTPLLVEHRLPVHENPDRPPRLVVVQDLKLEAALFLPRPLLLRQCLGGGVRAHEKVIGMAADGLLRRVAGEPRECRIHPFDLTRGPGDKHPVVGPAGDEGEFAALFAQLLGLTQRPRKPPGKEVAQAECTRDQRNHETEYWQHPTPGRLVDVPLVDRGQQGKLPLGKSLRPPGPFTLGPAGFVSRQPVHRLWEQVRRRSGRGENGSPLAVNQDDKPLL